MVSYWLLLVPGFIGGVALRRRRVPLYPLLAFVVTVIISVAPSIGDPRYRAAAEVPLVLLGAVGIDHVVFHRRTPSQRWRQPPAEMESSPPTDVVVSS
jgi:hypothetical protein